MKQRIDRSSPLPYYVQVKQSLQEQIEAGEWKAGDQLPGEPALCRIFDVSRTVIRQALDQLVQEGIIVREKGRGTFVTTPKLSGRGMVQTVTSFYDDMLSQGYRTESQVLRQHSVPASLKVASYLELEPGDPVLEIERLRFVRDEPVVLVLSYLPLHLCPALLHADLTQSSMYTFLKAHCNLEIMNGQRTIEAVSATERQAELLQIEPGAPLALLNSLSFLADGTPIEYYHAWYRGDRSRFEVDLIRRLEPGAAAQPVDLPEKLVVSPPGD